MAELKYNGNTVNSVVSQITNIAGKFDPLANTVKTSTGLMIGRKGFEIINPGLAPESICQAVGTCSEALGALVKEIRTKQVAILTYSQDKDEINAFVDSLSRLEYDSLDLSGIDSKISTWKKLSFAAKGIFASVGTFAAGFVEGAANFVETAVDTAAVVATGAASIFTKPYDLIAGTNITDEMWDSTKAYVAEEQVASIADQFYANTEAGQWLKENAYGFDTVRGIGKGVGYSTTMILAGNVFAGAGGVDATVKAARLAKALPAMSGVLGFGNASEEGWGNGATTEKGLAYGVAGGAWEAVQWGAGVKISSLGSHIDDIAKVGAKQVFKDACKRVMFDTVDSALEGFAQPTLTMIYRKYDGETFGQQWANAFETNGGWNSVLQQAVIGGVMSGASEAGDVFKYTREVAKSKKSGGGSGEGNKTTTPPGGSKSEEVFRKEGGGEQEARVETQENSNPAVVENGESNKAVVEQQATDTKAKKPVEQQVADTKAKKPVEQQAADTNAKKPVEQQATDKNANKSPMQKKPADPAPKQPVAPSPAKTTPKNNGGGKGAGVENHAAAVAPVSQNVRVEAQSNVDPNAKVNSPVTQVAPVKPAVETNARVNNQATQNATIKPAVDTNASVANPVTQTAPVKPAVDTNARVAGQTQAAPIKPVTEGGANATINSSTPARLGTDNPANLAAGLSSMVGDGKISGSDVSKAGVGVATMAGLGKIGTGMRASSMDADFNVDVKLKGETEIASARTSRQLSGDLEKMSKSLPTKQAKVEAAQTKLNNYRTEAGDAADPKVIKKLEGEVNKAQADYDKQLSRVKEKAEQRNAVATQEIDEKLASGSTKGLVGTERGKLVDGEFTKDRAKVISEIDKKEFSKLLDDTYGKVDKTKVDEFGNPKEIILDDPVVTDVVNADGTTSRHIVETDNVVRDVLLDKDGNVINEIVTKPDGSSSTFEVTPEKTIKTNLDKDGNLDSIVEFNSDGTTVIQKFNEDGLQSVGSFDANKNLKELKVANEEGKLEFTSKYEYDSKGKLISQFDEYSDGSATVRVTGADNSVGVSKFDSKGHLLESKITDGDGNVVSHTKNTFDQDGKFVSSVEKFEDGTSRTEDVRPSGYHETAVMDSNGRVLERKITDAKDNLVSSTNNTFDANGKLISSIERYSDGSSKVINTGADGSLGVGKFDSKGHLLESEITDGDGNVISSSKYTYDESGKLVSRVENNGPAADDINAKYGITDNEDYDSIMAKMDKAVEDGKISRQDADSLIERVAEEQHFDEKAEIARLREENAGYEKDRQANIERKELLVTEDGAKAENVKGYDEAVRQIDDQIKANNDKIAELEASIKEKPVEVQPETVEKSVTEVQSETVEKPVEVQPETVEKPVEVQPETVEKPVEVQPEVVEKPVEVQAEDINSKYGITDNEDYDSIMAKMDKAVEDGRISREDADSLIERVAEEQHFDEKAEIARLREENAGYEKDRQANIERKELLVTQDGAKTENVKGYDEAVRQIDDQIKANNDKIAELEANIKEKPVEVQPEAVEKPVEVQPETVEKPVEVQPEAVEKPVEVQPETVVKPAEDINTKYGITDNEDYDSIMAKMDKAVEEGRISREDADSLIERVAEEQHFDEKAEIARLREENDAYARDRQANIERKELLVTQDGAKAENVKDYDEAVRQIDDQIKANNDKITELEASIKDKPETVEKPVEVQPEAVVKPDEVQSETVIKSEPDSEAVVRTDAEPAVKPENEVQAETVVRPENDVNTRTDVEDINSKYGITDNEDYDSIMAKMDKAVEDGKISRQDADSLIERVAEEQHFDAKAEVSRLREENAAYERDRQANIDRKGLLVTQDGAKAENVKGYDEAVRQIDDQIKTNNTKIAELEKEINTPITRLGVDNTETKLTTDTLINNPAIEPEVVALGNAAAAVTTIGRLGTDVVAKGGDVTVKSINTETSTRTSKQLGADLEKLSTGLSDKQAKLDTAKANLDKYKAEMGDAADSKVVKKLEGEVSKAQSEYDKQLVKVKDKAEQRNATAAKEIDEKLASGSTKGLVGTEKGKIVDGEFTTESATAKGEISKKEFATETATRESLMRNDEAVEVKATDTVSDEVKAKFGITENENYDSLINKLEKAVESGELTKEAADDIFYKIAEEQHFDANDRIDALRAENAAYARDRQANIERKELLVTQDGAKAESVKGYDEAVRQIDERINSNNEEISRINQETGAVGSDSSTKVEGESNLDVIDTESLDAKFDRLSDEITSDINRTYGENAEVVRTEPEIKPEDSKVVTTATQESEVKDVPLSPAQQRAKEAELELEAKKKQLETELAADAKAEEVQLEKLRTESEQRLQEAHDADQRKLAEMEKDLEDTIRTENERIAQEEAAKNNESVISPDKNYTMKKADEGSVQAEKKVAETTSSNYKKMSEALDKARQSSNGEVVVDGKTYKASEITPDTMTAKRETTSRVEQDLASVRKKADEGSVRTEKKGTETTSLNYKKMSEALDNARQSIRADEEVVINGVTYKAADVVAQIAALKNGDNSPVVAPSSEYAMKKANDPTTKGGKVSEYLDRQKSEVRSGVEAHKKEVAAVVKEVKNKADAEPDTRLSADEQRMVKKRQEADRRKSEMTAKQEANREKMKTEVEQAQAESAKRISEQQAAADKKITEMESEVKARKEVDAQEEARFAKEQERLKAEINRVETAEVVAPVSYSDRMKLVDDLCANLGDDYAVGMHGIGMRSGDQDPNVVMNSIAQNGLEVRNNRTVHGTVEFFGRPGSNRADVTRNIDNYAYGGGNQVIIATPTTIKNANGEMIYIGGPNTKSSIVDYSRGGYDTTSLGDKCLVVDGKVPSEFVYGYFTDNPDGSVEFHPNPNHVSKTGGVVTDATFNHSKETLSREFNSDLTKLLSSKPSEAMLPEAMKVYDGLQKKLENPSFFNDPADIKRDMETVLQYQNDCKGKVDATRPVDAPTAEVKNDTIVKPEETVVRTEEDTTIKPEETRVENGKEEAVVRTEEDTTIKPEETRVENVSEEAVVRAEEDTTVKPEETRVENGREEAVVRTGEDTTVKPVETRVESDDARVKTDEQLARLTKEHDAEVDRIKQKQEQDIDAARRDKNRQLMDEEARYNDEVARLKKQHARHEDDLSLYRGENATGVKATERQLKQKYEGLYEERLYNLEQQHKSRMADIESRGNATIRNIESRYSEDIKVVDKMLQDVKTDVANGNLTGQALGAKKLISDYDNFVRRQSEYDADRRAIIDRYNAQKADVENAYRGDMNSLENFNEQARSVVRRGEMEPTYYLERAGLDGICDRNGLKKLEVFFDEESVFVRRLYEGDSEFVLRNKNNRIAELDARMNQELRDLETRYRESGMDVTDQYKKYEMAIESDDISQDALKALDKQLEMDELLADFTDDSVAVERIQSLRKGIEEKIGVQTDSSVRVTPQETSSTPVELKQDVPVQKIVNADEAATVSPVATRTASDPIVTKYTGKDGSSYRQQINPDGSRIESNYNNKGELINQKTIDKNGAYSTYELGTDGSKTTSNFAKDGTLISSKVVHKNGITEVTFKSDFNDTYSYSKVDSKGDFIEQRFTTQKGDDVHIKYNPDRSSYSHVVGADGTIKDMTYDSNNNIIRHTEKRPDGTVIDSRYKDKIITDQSVSKPDGSRIVYSKNSEGATTTTYDADGYPIKVESVDSSGTKVTTDQFQNGNYRKNVVDKSGKLLEEVVYTNGETTTTTYGADNTKTIRTEKNGRFTQTKYDANGDKVEFSYDSDDGTVHKTEYVSKDVRIYNSYYTDGRVSETVINKDGSYTTTTFNKDKKPIEIIDSSADKVVTYTKFNEDGSSSISTINKDNQVVDIVETSADKVVTHTKVNDDGTKLVHVKEPNGYETQVLYSRDNKPINAFENKLDGTFVNKRFDGDGNLIETISTAKSGTVTVETRHTDGSTTTKVTASDDSLVETVMKDKNGKVTREVSEYQNGTKYDKVINPDGSSSVKVLNPDKTYDIRKLDSNGKLVERQWTTKDGTIRTQTPLPDGTAKRHTVDANGNVRDSILRGNTLLEQVETRPDGSKQLYKVNSDGSRTYTEIDPNGGKNITIRKPDNTFETTVLDSKGRIIEERWSDKNGRITTERPNGDGTFSRRVVESDRRVIDSVMDKYGNIIRQTDRGPDGTTTTYVRNSDGTYDRRTVNKDNKLLAREYKDSAGTLRVEKANGDGTYSRRTTKRDGTVSDTVFSRSGEILHRIENRPDKSKIITERTADGGKVVTEISKDGVSVRHVYDKYGNEVRPQPNVRQQPQQTGQRQSIFDRLRRQQPQAQPQQMPIFRNAQEVISSIRNPLDDNYDKIFRRLFDGNSESFYDKLVSVNTKSAKIQPNVQSIKKFHDTFDLDSSRGKRYVNSRGDYIYHQYGYFDHVRSQDFIGGTDRLYLNIPDFNQTYKFCELFAAECKNRGIPYYFKTASADNVRIIKRKQLFRDEAVVIYSGKEYLSDYVNIASDIVSKYGIKLEEPPILAGRLKNNIGYGAEPDGNYVGFGKYSYNSLRSEIIEKAVINLKLDYERRGLDINSNRYYTDLKNLIIEYGKEVGISPDNFCNNIEEIY